MRGFGVTATLFPGGTLKNATHTSPGNPEQSNQSDDDFDTPEVFPNKCTILLILYFIQKGHIEIKMNFFFQGVLDMLQTFSQLAVGMTYEAETTDYMAPILGSKWTCAGSRKNEQAKMYEWLWQRCQSISRKACLIWCSRCQNLPKLVQIVN